MHVQEKYYDEVFNFKGQWDVPSSCGLKILKKEKTIVIVTELYQDNPGTSVTAAGFNLVSQICESKGLSFNDIIYLECKPGTNSKLSFYDEEFFEVTFTESGKPSYRQLGVQELKELLPEGLQ